MIQLVLWYLVISLIGWLVFPLTIRLFRGLKDRGYAFSRALGLILWGFAFWLLGSFQIAQNDLGGVVLALIPLGGLVYWVGRKGQIKETWVWLKQNIRYVATAEILFLVLFVAWAFVRSTNPDITGTEKPMELAFINAILRSPHLPPSDPWLAGYSISYYYFGYILVSMLIRITGTASGVAFNLAVSHTFALAGLGAYGLLYNLLNSRMSGHSDETIESGNRSGQKGIFSALTAPLFLLVMSNFEGFLEFLHSAGLFWKTDTTGQLTSGFWKWLDILELTDPPVQPFSFWPSRPSGIIYWRASRVLQDYDLIRAPREIIDEFPFFSYILSDLHPHVLAMPFVLLGMALALNLFMEGAKGENHFLGFNLEVDRLYWIIVCVVLGGLAFLNTWDFPIGVALFSAAYAFIQARKYGWRRRVIGDFFLMAVCTAVLSYLFYLPFYIGFASQAGGLIPSIIYFTRGAHFWVMFGTLLIPIFTLLWIVFIRRGNSELLGKSLLVSGALIGLLWLGSFLLGGLAVSLPGIGAQLSKSTNYYFARLGSRLTDIGALFLNTQGASLEDTTSLIGEAFFRRLVAPGTWLTLLALIALTLGGLFILAKTKSNQQEAKSQSDTLVLPDGFGFVLLMILLGSLLTIFPEFFYLRDQFGWRMNTIFKFYYQAWMLWSIAAAFAVVILFRSLHGTRGWVIRGVLGLVIVAGMAYPLISLDYKTNHFSPTEGYNLDGNAYLNRYSQEVDGIRWLQNAPYGVVAESVGGSYSQFARISTLTGQPAVLGWTPHESQWRGGSKEMGSRMQDIQTLYSTNDWTTAESIINQYHIRYVVVGALELSTYQVNLDKFKRHCAVDFDNPNISIYECSPDVNSDVAEGQ